VWALSPASSWRPTETAGSGISWRKGLKNFSSKKNNLIPFALILTQQVSKGRRVEAGIRGPQLEDSGIQQTLGTSEVLIWNERGIIELHFRLVFQSD
jgi:hypothetical protein